MKQQQALPVILAGDCNLWHLILIGAELSVLGVLAEVLKPLFIRIGAVSGEKQVTASALQPVIKHALDVGIPGSDDGPLQLT